MWIWSSAQQSGLKVQMGESKVYMIFEGISMDEIMEEKKRVSDWVLETEPLKD